MPESPSVRAVELLLEEAWAAYIDDRYVRAGSIASVALQAAEELDDLVLVVRALHMRATATRMAGDHVSALADCTRILALAEDPATNQRLGPPAHFTIARAYREWVAAARFITDIPIPDLFAVLDAGERWLLATGHGQWRHGFLTERSALHSMLGDYPAAVAAAEEALACYRRDSPGPSLNNCRWNLGNALRRSERPDDAVAQFQAVLDDSAVNAFDRKVANEGLARCALALGDLVEARARAELAVAQAEFLGDEALTTALDGLIAVTRTAGDLDAAWAAANRGLECARRLGAKYRLYYAIRGVIEVALDRGDTDTARLALEEGEPYAVAMDRATSSSTYTSEVAQYGKRLAELEESG